MDADVLSDSAAAYVQGLSLISERRSGTSKFYHSDALGSTRAITNASQGVTDTKESDAFGLTWSTGTSGTTPTPFGFGAAHGYQSDVDSGLMRLGHRYYDPSTGRFLSRDPILDGYNWYTYVENDPVNNADPEGLEISSLNSRTAPLLRQIGDDIGYIKPPSFRLPTIGEVIVGIGIALGLVNQAKDLSDKSQDELKDDLYKDPKNIDRLRDFLGNKNRAPNPAAGKELSREALEAYRVGLTHFLDRDFGILTIVASRKCLLLII